MAASFADVAGARYVLLTTFTTYGRSKPTPIRGAAVDGTLLVFTGIDSWKVRRLRNNPRVRLAACTFRGRPLSDGVQGIATLLDRSGTECVYSAIRGQYGRLGWLYALFTKFSGGLDTRIGIEVIAATDNTNTHPNND